MWTYAGGCAVVKRFILGMTPGDIGGTCRAYNRRCGMSCSASMAAQRIWEVKRPTGRQCGGRSHCRRHIAARRRNQLPSAGSKEWQQGSVCRRFCSANRVGLMRIPTANRCLSLSLSHALVRTLALDSQSARSMGNQPALTRCPGPAPARSGCSRTHAAPSSSRGAVAPSYDTSIN